MNSLKIKHFIAAMLLALLCVVAIPVLAIDSPRIQVMALFSNKAVVRVNGKQLLLKVGTEAKDGVRLVKASSKQATIEINGIKKVYGLGSQVSTGLSKPKKSIVRIPSRRGMYLTPGLINGRSVDLLVDTGASVVAMSRVTADRLQISYRETGVLSKVSTASELKRAWSVKLNSVTVGGITLQQVDGVVIDTVHDQQILLGMSFLNRLKFTQEQGVVVLEAKAQ